jgi:outer membrane protein
MKKMFLIAAMAFVSLAATAQDFKFAYVDMNELIMLMPEMDAAREQLATAEKEAQETYNAMVEEYQTKAQQYQQKAETWTVTIRESKAAELQQIEYRIQEFNQAISQELQQTQQTLQMPILEKAQNVVNELAKAKGVAYVVDRASLLYVDEKQGVNLTPEARVKLNIPEGRTLETLQAELQAKAQAAQAATEAAPKAQ